MDARPGTLKETDDLLHIGWESLSVLEFQSFVEIEFKTMVSLQQVVASKTIGDLVALVRDKLAD